MMKSIKIKKVIAGSLMAAFIMCLPTIVSAQDSQNKWKLELNYNVSKPMGSLKSDFIDKTSFRGFTGEIKYSVSPRFAIGLQSGFQNYYQKYPRQEYKFNDNQTISAVVTNNMEIIPLLAKATFYPLGNAKGVTPYLSGAAGVNMVNYEQYLGEFGGTDVSTPLALQAGAGIKIPFGKEKQNGFVLGATYNYSAYKENELNNLNSVGLNAGIVFPLR